MSDLVDEFMKRSSAKGNLHAPQAAGYEDSPVAGVIARELSTNPFAMGHYSGAMMNRAANIERYSQDLTKANALQAMLQKYITDQEGKGGMLNSMMRFGVTNLGPVADTANEMMGEFGVQMKPGELAALRAGHQADVMKIGGEAIDRTAQGGADPTAALNQVYRGVGLEPTTPTTRTSEAAAAASGGGQAKITTTLPNGQQVSRPEKYPGEAADLEAQGRSTRADARARLDGSTPAPARPAAPAQAPAAPAQPTANSVFGQEATGTLADNNVRRLIATFKLKDPNAEANVKVNRVPGQHAYFIHAPNGKTFTCDIHGCRKNP